MAKSDFDKGWDCAQRDSKSGVTRCLEPNRSPGWVAGYREGRAAAMRAQTEEEVSNG